MTDDEGYRGVFGAVPYAVRQSDSWTFRVYGVLGALLTVLVALLFALAIVGVFAATSSARGGEFTFSRAFFVFVALLVVAPLLAPILSVARRHRHRAGDAAYDATMGALGLAFVGSLYVGLVATVPPEQQEAVGSGVVGDVVRYLYDLPQLAGLVPPAVVALAIFAAHWWRGSDGIDAAGEGDDGGAADAAADPPWWRWWDRWR
jgi:hypothetical protein